MKYAYTLIVLLAAFSMSLSVFADERVSDDEIYDKVRVKLAGDRDVKGGNLEVRVEDGVVTLRGRVDKDKAKEKAEKLASKVEGVREVINELTVTPW